MQYTRREWLLTASTALSGASLASIGCSQRELASTGRVAVANCRGYGPELLPAMTKLFDQLGGLGRIVKGKTVAVKINLTGEPTYRLQNLPLGDTHYTNPQVIAATVHLIGKAGARRIRVLESPMSSAERLEDYFLRAQWNPKDVLSAASDVEFENTNYLGNGRKYSRLFVPGGGYIYPAYDLNHSYEDCDVFVSVAKMKEHATAGITLSMKNCFGITPATVYGAGAGMDEPSEMPKGARSMLHSGKRQPPRSAPQEKDPDAPRAAGYRVPRIVVDLAAARPIHLAVVEGIRTMTGGEGPWIEETQTAINPGVIVAGTNPVATDAVCMAIMGFDPMAEAGTPPFEDCDSTLRLAEDIGIGTRDLKKIELVGTPIDSVKFDFAAIRRQRRA